MKNIYIILSVLIVSGCGNSKKLSQDTDEKVKLITLDPGHFHAALVQKSMYPDVDSNVYVYAPKGDDLNSYLGLITKYNSDPENPTAWNEIVYTGDDFLEKMLAEKKGNVVVLAGNNLKKINYINQAINGGLNVLSDKPMAIDKTGFETLKNAFEKAADKNLLLYDIMTERYEITSVLQKEFSQLQEVFGSLEKGTLEHPAVTKESVHHFYKKVSGNTLTRPYWFFDANEQGEGIVDVTTHLVDLVQWGCFPEQILDYKKDIAITAAKRWSTDLTLDQFSNITNINAFPTSLNKDVKDNLLKVYANGEINYVLKGVHVKVSVKWNYKAPEGTSDTHYSIMRGTTSNLIIRQAEEQKYKPELYIEPVNGKSQIFKDALLSKVKGLQQKYPGVDIVDTEKGWQVVIPGKYKEGHEAHFARVTENFLSYIKAGALPKWEVPNMIAKYFTTTSALELAKQNKK